MRQIRPTQLALWVHYNVADAMALLAGQWTCDSQVAGSSPGCMEHHCVVALDKLLTHGKGGDLFGWESNRGPGGE